MSASRARRVVLAVGITHFGFNASQAAGASAGSSDAQLCAWRCQPIPRQAGAGRRRRSICRGLRRVACGCGHRCAPHGTSPEDRLLRSGARSKAAAPAHHPVRARVWGFGWKYVVCVDAPHLFRAPPERLRLRVVRRHLGPSPAWFMKEKGAEPHPHAHECRSDGGLLEGWPGSMSPPMTSRASRGRSLSPTM